MATAPDQMDLDQDGRVTKSEIDTAAGKSPGYFSGGLLGNIVRMIPTPANVAFGLNDRQARKDDWEQRRSTMYAKYGITAPAAPGARPEDGYPTAGGRIGRGGTAAAAGAAPGTGQQLYPDSLLGAQGALAHPLSYASKSPFPTLGVNQGLIDLGIVREQMDAAGNIVYVTPRKGGESVVMQYKAQDAYMTLAEMDDEQRGNFRRAMYISGYGTPSIWAGPLNTSDVSLMVKAMTDANMSGLSWDEVVNRRVEAGGRYARPLTMYEAAINSGDTASVLKQYAQRNGIVLSDSFIANQQRAVADGQIEMEDLLTLIKETYVKTLYPAFTAEVDQGLTIEDLAGPWRSKIAETFGVPEEQISLFDPLLQAALQNFDPHGVPSKTKMNDFTEMVMQDPRWEYSPDAWNKVGMALDQLSASFGAANTYAAPTTGYGTAGGGYRG